MGHKTISDAQRQRSQHSVAMEWMILLSMPYFIYLLSSRRLRWLAMTPLPLPSLSPATLTIPPSSINKWGFFKQPCCLQTTLTTTQRQQSQHSVAMEWLIRHKGLRESCRLKKNGVILLDRFQLRFFCTHVGVYYFMVCPSSQTYLCKI